MASKAEGQKFLNYLDVQTISQSVRNVFINQIGFVPNEIDSCLRECESEITPKHSWKILAVLICIAGLGIIFKELAVIFKWGISLVARIFIFLFKGISMLGPIAWIGIGCFLVIMAGYIAFSSNDPNKNNKKYMDKLRNDLKKAVHEAWKEISGKLSEK